MISQIIKSFIKAKKPAIQPDPMAWCKQTYRVWPHQIDYNLHLNNAKYLTLLEHARWNHFIDIGKFKPMFDQRLNVVIAALEISFIRELGLFTKFEIHSRFVTWDEKYMYIEQRLIVKGKLYGHVTVKLAGVRKGKRVMPEQICEVLGIDYALGTPVPYIENWAEMSQAKRDYTSES
ncbi:MAG: acyl-CoA thioesterase [Oleibacter sp.]|nr:acyl-CoA thioesterase [Thalassolituus sp.]